VEGAKFIRNKNPKRKVRRATINNNRDDDIGPFAVKNIFTVNSQFPMLLSVSLACVIPVGVFPLLSSSFQSTTTALTNNFLGKRESFRGTNDDVIVFIEHAWRSINNLKDVCLNKGDYVLLRSLPLTLVTLMNLLVKLFMSWVLIICTES
jgi:hypothetical protein